MSSLLAYAKQANVRHWKVSSVTNIAKEILPDKIKRVPSMAVTSDICALASRNKSRNCCINSFASSQLLIKLVNLFWHLYVYIYTMQTKVNFWLRVSDRPKWEALKAKGIPVSEILSRGIQLVYEQEFKEERRNNDTN